MSEYTTVYLRHKDMPLDFEKAIPEFNLKTSVFENFITPQLGVSILCAKSGNT
jgi:hypothetical protein